MNLYVTTRIAAMFVAAFGFCTVVAWSFVRLVVPASEEGSWTYPVCMLLAGMIVGSAYVCFQAWVINRMRGQHGQQGHPGWHADRGDGEPPAGPRATDR